MRIPPRAAVSGLLGFALGALIAASLVWLAGGTSAQIHRDAWICGGISMFVGMAIGAEP